MKHPKRLIALLTALTLFISLVPAVFAAGAEPSLQNAQERLFGFEGASALPDGDEPVSVIVLFDHNPAGIQVIQAEGTRQSLSAQTAERNVEDDHALFRQELAGLFSSGGFAAAAQGYEIRHEYRRSLNGVSVTLPANMVLSVAAFNSVRAIFPNEILHFEFPEPQLMAAQRDPIGMLPGRVSMRADEMHELGYRGEGVVVAVFDTGIDYNHPAFEGTFPTLADMHARGAAHITESDLLNGYFKGRNIMYGEDSWDCEDCMDGDNCGYCVGRGPNDPMDVGGHGTHVAGTIVGQDTGEAMSILGVAPDALHFHYRVIESATPVANIL